MDQIGPSSQELIRVCATLALLRVTDSARRETANSHADGELKTSRLRMRTRRRDREIGLDRMRVNCKVTHGPETTYTENGMQIEITNGLYKCKSCCNSKLTE